MGTISKTCKIHCPNPPKPKGGCPRTLNDTARGRAVQLGTAGNSLSTKAATKELEEVLDIELSTKTVQWALVEEGLVAVTKQEKPKLTREHIKARWEFAERHKHWTVEDWKRVGWSDETPRGVPGLDREYAWKD